MIAITLTAQQAVDELKDIDTKIKKLLGRKEFLEELLERPGGILNPRRAKGHKTASRNQKSRGHR